MNDRPKPNTLVLRPRRVRVAGRLRPAVVARAPGLDVTLRPGQSWPANAIAPEGEALERTLYITNLLRQGDLELVASGPELAQAEPELED